MEPHNEPMNQWVLSMPKLRFLVCTTKLPRNCSWWLLRIGRRNDVKRAAQCITRHQDQAQRDLGTVSTKITGLAGKTINTSTSTRVEHKLWEEALLVCTWYGAAGQQECSLVCSPGGKGWYYNLESGWWRSFLMSLPNSRGHHLKGQSLKVRAVLAVYWRWGFGIQCSVSWTSLSGRQAQAGVWRGEGTSHALSSTALHRHQPPVPSHTHTFI